MKLVKTLLATTLALTAFSTFAATADKDSKKNEVLSSSQENPVNVETTAAQPSAAQPGTSEAAAAEGVEAPATAQPAQ